METFRKYLRIILNIIIPIAGIILTIWLAPKLLSFFMPFIIGYIISLIANPMVRFLEKRLKIVRKHGSVIIVVLVLGLVIIGLYLFASVLFTEVGRFVSDLPAMAEDLTKEIDLIIDKYAHILDRLPISFNDGNGSVVDNLSTTLMDWVKSIASPTISATGNVVKSIPNFLIQLFIVVLSAFFLTSERDELYAYMRNKLPEKGVYYTNLFRTNIKSLVGGYFTAQLRIMVVVALVLFIGFVALGVKYNLLLALLVAFLDFLPVFGTGTVLLPWALVKLLSGEYSMTVGLLIIYLASQAIRQIIQPKIVGDTMGLRPLPTLFFLYLGFRFYGIGGMILAVPVGIFILELNKIGLFDSLIKNIKLLIIEINSFRKADTGKGETKIKGKNGSSKPE